MDKTIKTRKKNARKFKRRFKINKVAFSCLHSNWKGKCKNLRLL